MLESFYHVALKLFRNNVFGVKMSKYCHTHGGVMGIMTLCYKKYVVHKYKALYHSQISE